jgi:hypothetical protein
VKAHTIKKRIEYRFYKSISCLYKVKGNNAFFVNFDSERSDYELSIWRHPSRGLNEILNLTEITKEQAKELNPMAFK